MKIAVLGSGPSGLLAAEAASIAGHDVTIFSKSRKPSVITGAQYIHEAIPCVTNNNPDGNVIFHKVGTAEGYAKKVYGRIDAPTSWSIFPEGSRPMWSMAKIYDKLHHKWSEKINTRDIDSEWLNYLENKRDMFPLVISSIPAPIICKIDYHIFPKVDVVFETHNFVNEQLGENYIYYSGSESDDWYRSSMIGGHGWFEYGIGNAPVVNFIDGKPRQLRNGIKPLDTDCDCRKRMIRVGRWGEWKKARLVHHSYRKVFDALEVTEKPLRVPN